MQGPKLLGHDFAEFGVQRAKGFVHHEPQLRTMARPSATRWAVAQAAAERRQDILDRRMRATSATLAATCALGTPWLTKG